MWDCFRGSCSWSHLPPIVLHFRYTAHVLGYWNWLKHTLTVSQVKWLPHHKSSVQDVHNVISLQLTMIEQTLPFTVITSCNNFKQWILIKVLNFSFHIWQIGTLEWGWWYNSHEQWWAVPVKIKLRERYHVKYQYHFKLLMGSLQPCGETLFQFLSSMYTVQPELNPVLQSHQCCYYCSCLEPQCLM